MRKGNLTDSERRMMEAFSDLGNSSLLPEDRHVSDVPMVPTQDPYIPMEDRPESLRPPGWSDSNKGQVYLSKHAHVHARKESVSSPTLSNDAPLDIYDAYNLFSDVFEGTNNLSSVTAKVVRSSLDIIYEVLINEVGGSDEEQ